MTCREFWKGMPELEQDPSGLDHVQQCPSCAALLADQHALAAGLRRLGLESRHREAPARVEARLLASFREQAATATERPRAIAWRVWVPAAAAVIVLAVFLVRGRPTHAPQPQDFTAVSTPADSANVDLAGLDADYIAAPYAAGAAPADDTDWVRLEVPRSTLIALGFPVAVDAGSEPVEAEVALSANGVVQGVRLLQ